MLACCVQGYSLTHARMEATWGEEHCPAYFVATHTEDKELLVCIKGTSQMEDLLADVTAFPVVRTVVDFPCSSLIFQEALAWLPPALELFTGDSGCRLGLQCAVCSVQCGCVQSQNP